MSYLYPLYSGKPLVDLEVGFPFSDFTLSVSAQNIFNTYPDENPGAVSGVGNRYGSSGRSDSTAATTTRASASGGVPLTLGAETACTLKCEGETWAGAGAGREPRHVRRFTEPFADGRFGRDRSTTPSICL